MPDDLSRSDDLLDAARRSVLGVGVRRTTMSEVARLAGVSRMTLYRSFPDAQSLLARLMAREFETVVEPARRAAADRPTARERLVEATVAGVEAIAVNPLFARILELDPELLLTYITERLGESQLTVTAMFQGYLDEGARDGSTRTDDPRLVAYCLQLVARAFVVSRRITERAFEPAAAAGELRRMLDAYLRP